MEKLGSIMGGLFKWVSFGIAVLIIGLLFAQVYTANTSRSLHAEWHTHLEAGHTEIAEDLEKRRESILTIHVVIGYLMVLFAVIEGFLIAVYWKT